MSRKLLGRKCSRLAEKGHGAWYARFEAPPGADGKRRQLRTGPHATAKEARQGVTAALGKIDAGMHADDRKTTLATHLDKWLEWKQAGLKPSTFTSYSEAIELYFRPGLGHVRLADLRAGEIKDLYTAMRKISRAEDGDPSELLRRLVAARATWRATGSAKTVTRVSTRPLTDARIRRVHAVLRAALNDAGLPVNPAAQVRFGKQRKARPMLWTEARVERWRETGEVPAKVMVWSAAQCGQFLDSVEGQRLYALFHVAAYFGLRRSELIGLTWSEADLARRHIHVRQAQVDDVLDSTKSEDSERIIAVDPGTVDVLKAWRKVQAAERLAWGPAWTDSGRVFTREDGTPLRPGWVSERFGTLSGRAGLPPVTFHGLRHGAATMLLAAGQPIKVISEILGHATSAFTADVYTEVAEELAEQAASAIAAYVPRQRKMSHQ